MLSRVLTLENVVASKFGNVGMLGNEVFQETCEVIALPQCHVGAEQILVYNPQVEIVAKRVHVHEVTHFVTLFCEEHRKLGRRKTWS